MLSTVISLIPFSRDDAFKIVGIGADDSAVTAALREAFPRATLVPAALTTDRWKSIRWGAAHHDAFQEQYGVKLGFMSFFTKAVVAALKAVPDVNAENVAV